MKDDDLRNLVKAATVDGFWDIDDEREMPTPATVLKLLDRIAEFRAGVLSMRDSQISCYGDYSKFCERKAQELIAADDAAQK